MTLFLSTQSFANAEFSEVSCWDGSFGYNTFSVQRDGGKVVLGVAGHELGPIDFGSGFQEHIDIPTWGNNRNALFMALDESECVEDETSIECTRPRPRRAFFVKKDLRDIDETKEVISEVFLEALSFSVEKHADHFKVEAIISEFGNQHSLSKTFPIVSNDPTKPCFNHGGSSFSETSQAPSRLLDFIKK